jgi:hypothetical protein
MVQQWQAEIYPGSEGALSCAGFEILDARFPFEVGLVGLASTKIHLVVGAPRSYLTPRASTLANSARPECRLAHPGSGKGNLGGGGGAPAGGPARDSGVDMAARMPLTKRENVSWRSGFGRGSSKVKPPSGSRPCNTTALVGAS